MDCCSSGSATKNKKLKGHLNAALSDLATERERQLTTARANLGLTNGRAAN